MKRIGFGQVEPNHLSAQRNGQIYAQRKYKGDREYLENGMFLKYTISGKDEVASVSGEGEWMLVLNEVKLYDDAWRESYKDFAMKPDNSNEMTPRLFKTAIGDIFTTNTLGDGTADVEVAVGNKLTVGADGYLKVTESPSAGEMVWLVVKVYTMPDNQPAVKIRRIA
jgi:hypothetical protein